MVASILKPCYNSILALALYKNLTRTTINIFVHKSISFTSKTPFIGTNPPQSSYQLGALTESCLEILRFRRGKREPVTPNAKHRAHDPEHSETIAAMVSVLFMICHCRRSCTYCRKSLTDRWLVLIYLNEVPDPAPTITKAVAANSVRRGHFVMVRFPTLLN